MAGVVTAQTKSGSNAFHGSVFEFRRSGAQQARDPFTQSAPDPVTHRFIPPTLWNQFGGSVGGPILKDKFFFFGDYQGTRQKAGTTVQASVPTQLVRTTCLVTTGLCDLSEYLGGGQGQVYDPSSGGANGAGRTPFAGNLIPVGKLAPQAVNILKLLPAPNQLGISNNYTASGTGGFNNDQFDIRIDGQVSQKLHAFGRYTFFNSHLNGSPAFGAIGGPGFGFSGFAGRDFSRDHSVAAGVDYVLNSTLLSDVRVGWFQYYVHNQKFDQGGTPEAHLLLRPGHVAGNVKTDAELWFALGRHLPGDRYDQRRGRLCRSEQRLCASRRRERHSDQWRDQNKLTNFAPRVGVAYSPNERTVIRLGYGRSFDEGVFGSIFGTALTHNIPVVANQALQGASSFDPAFTLGTGPTPYVAPAIPANGLIPLSNNVSYAGTRPAQFSLPTVDMWNVSLQQQIAPTLSFEIAYVGNRGASVYPGDGGGYNTNGPAVGSGPQQQRRPFFNRFVNGGSVCCNSDLGFASPDATNSYNSLQARLDKRISKGLQFGAFYTWSRALGYSDQYFNIDPKTTYGRNDINRDQNFVVSLLYDLPFGKGKQFGSGASSWLNELIGGWQFNTVTTWAGGVPFTPGYNECTADEDIGGVGNPLCRPDSVGGFSYGAGSLNPVTHSVSYFTPVAPLAANGAVSGPFRRPQQFHFGNIGRDSATGPGLVGSDMSVFKGFTVGERVNAQFRFDAFNAFNHPALGQPNACVDCTTGQPGQITSLLLGTQPRRLQFGVRATF